MPPRSARRGNIAEFQAARNFPRLAAAAGVFKIAWLMIFRAAMMRSVAAMTAPTRKPHGRRGALADQGQHEAGLIARKMLATRRTRARRMLAATVSAPTARVRAETARQSRARAAQSFLCCLGAIGRRASTAIASMLYSIAHGRRRAISRHANDFGRAAARRRAPADDFPQALRAGT